MPIRPLESNSSPLPVGRTYLVVLAAVILLSIVANKDHQSRNVNQVLACNCCGSHEELEHWIIRLPRGIQLKPFRIDKRTTVNPATSASPLHPAITRTRVQNSHLSTQPTVVCSQWRVIKSPPFQIVKVPVLHGQSRRDLHPVPLCLKVSVHRWCLVA